MAEEFVRQSQLLDQLVLDRATMDERGRIEVMWCYPKVHRVLGFICKSGRFDRTKLAFNLDQIDKVGENGVLVNSDPVETDRDRVQQLETLIGCEVWSDEGTKVGRISDYVFQLASGNIRYYLLSSNGLQGLTGKLYALYPSQILGYGRGRVMVSAGIVPGLELIQVGLDQKLEARFTGFEERLESKLKRTADRISERLNDEQLNQNLQQNLQSGMKSWVGRARSVTASVTAKVKDRAQEFLEDGLGDDTINSKANSDPEAVDFDFDYGFDSEDPESTKVSDRSREQARNQLRSRDGPPRREPDRPVHDSRNSVQDDEWNDDRMSDRPPLPNLSPKHPPTPPPSKSFTAQPRSPDAKPQDGLPRDRDAWDDDEWV